MVLVAYQKFLCLNQCHKNFFCFSSVGLTLTFTFCTSWVDFCTWCKVRAWVCFLACSLSTIPAPFVEKHAPSPLTCVGLLSTVKRARMQGHLCTQLCTPICHTAWQQAWKSGGVSPPTLFFFKTVLATLGYFQFHIEFRTLLFYGIWKYLPFIWRVGCFTVGVAANTAGLNLPSCCLLATSPTGFFLLSLSALWALKKSLFYQQFAYELYIFVLLFSGGSKACSAQVNVS